MVNGNQFQVWEFNSFDCAKRTVIGIYGHGQAVDSCKRANQFRIRINWKDQTVSVLNDTHQHRHRDAVDGRRQRTQPYTCWRFDTNAENYIVIWGWFHCTPLPSIGQTFRRCGTLYAQNHEMDSMVICVHENATAFRFRSFAIHAYIEQLLDEVSIPNAFIIDFDWT